MTLSAMLQLDTATSMEEVEDILIVMKRKEETVYRRFDYLASSPNYQVILDASWRQRIVEWMFGVVDHCSLRRDSIAVAAYYLDKSVEKGIVETRQDFQLAAMTALQLAIKLYDSTVVKLDSMIKLGRGLFTEQDVIDMEKKILKALDFHVHPPTPICFLRQYLLLLPATITPVTRYLIGEVTRFISEISVCLYKFINYPPSIVAYAGMLIAMERIDEVTLPLWQRQHIYAIMASVANLDYRSAEVMNTVTQLQFSLEKNVSLQDLMNSIGAQCRQEGFMMMASPNYSPINSKLEVHHQSPRDVRGQ